MSYAYLFKYIIIGDTGTFVKKTTIPIFFLALDQVWMIHVVDHPRLCLSRPLGQPSTDKIHEISQDMSIREFPFWSLLLAPQNHPRNDVISNEFGL